MKKGISILMMMMLVIGLLAGCGSESSTQPKEGETITLKLANNSPVGESRDLAALKFAELVEEKTNGKVVVEVFSGGTLGSWRDTVEGLKPGIVNVVLESLGTISAYTELANIDAVPFLYRDDDHFKQVWYRDLGNEILEKAGQEGGFEMLGPMYRGARYVTSKKNIATASDLNGFKIRVPNIRIYMRTWEKLGAIATPMNFTEVYTGIQQGTVDGQENPLQVSYAAALYEVCPYLINTKHVYSVDTFIFDRDYFASLPEEAQGAIKEAASEAGLWRTDFVIEMDDQIIKDFESKGVTFVEPEIDTFKVLVQDIVEEEFPDLVDFVKKIEAVQ